MAKKENAASSPVNETYSVNGDKVVRVVELKGRLLKSELAIPTWVSRKQDAAAVYDQVWLSSKVNPGVKNPTGTVRAIDLFCGCGGLTLGIQEACRALGLNFQPVFASDINTSALALYCRNFSPFHFDSKPIETHVDGDLGGSLTKAEKAFKKMVGAVDIIVAGPPCQGNSDLNNHTRRNDPKNLLYLRAVRSIEVLKPHSAIIENVPGVLHEAHSVLQTAVSHLKGLGYKVCFGVLPMREIGVPQNRKRMFLLATRKSQLSIDGIVGMNRCAERSLAWACEDLLPLYDENSTFDSSANHSEVNKRRIHYLFEHDLHDLPNSQRPDCHRLKEHGYTAVYGRMYWDIPAPTITGGFGSCGQGRFVHPLRERTLTPHEAARVQFFPDFFDFSGVLRRELQQVIGNAVPSKAGYVVALPLLKAAIEKKES